MNNWDKWKRMQCNLNKAVMNAQVANLMIQNYQQLWNEFVKTPEDQDVFNDAYLKLTYKYVPEQDFVEQFRHIFKQLKGAYYRDDSANHYYQLNEDRLNVPEPEEEVKVRRNVDIITKLQQYAIYRKSTKA